MSKTKLVVFSIAQHAVVRAVAFPEHVGNIRLYSTPTMIVVAMDNGHVKLFSAGDVHCVHTITDTAAAEMCKLDQEPHLPQITVGHRLIAYTTAAPPPAPTRRTSAGLVPRHRANSDAAKLNGVGMSRQPSNGSVSENDEVPAKVAVERVAKDVVHGVKALGGYGYKAVSDWYLGRSPPTPASSSVLSSSPTNHAMMMKKAKSGNRLSGTALNGTVLVRDLNSKKAVAHFKAHEHGCAAIQFDPSGRLLVTAAARGDTFRIWSVASRLTDEDDVDHVRLVRTLSRGLTSATIVDMRFDDESKWLAVSTTRGTSHMFRIDGSNDDDKHDVDPRRIAAISLQSPSLRPRPSTSSPSSLSASPTTHSYLNGTTRSPMARVKQPSEEEDDFYSMMDDAPAFEGSIAWFGRRNTHQQRDVYTCNGYGAKMTMHRLYEGEMDVAEVLEDVAEWRLGRARDWPVVKAPNALKRSHTLAIAKHAEDDLVASESLWLKHAELVTYPPHRVRPLWTTTWFSFSTFVEGSESDDQGNRPTAPLQVKQIAPTPYGWARGEDGEAVPSVEIQEKISNAMDAHLHLPPLQHKSSHTSIHSVRSHASHSSLLVQDTYEQPLTLISLEAQPDQGLADQLLWFEEEEK